MDKVQSDFELIRKEYLAQIEESLNSFFKASAQETGSLCVEMSLYHFETGGKRLRALIPLVVYKLLGRNPKEAVPLGAAVEMIHNATLVHDDLQDGDEVRRSRATVWKRYSPAQAINCGDAMFQYAFRLLNRLEVDPARKLKLIDRAASTTLRVIEGQAQEFAIKDQRFAGLDQYLEVIRGKTSGLFALPIVGAMEALGETAESCQVVEKASMDLGMLFQIQDDLLDIYGSKGRDRVATDVAEGKISIFVAHVNQVGGHDDKEKLAQILRKSRGATTDKDIQEALAIFARYDAKGMAVRYIRDIQNKIAVDASLKKYPEYRGLLIGLGELFLEPVHAIL
ncbi:MAG: polyprenyl synthetase family protein [Bdellovibrionota bacterium]